jgi:hypothetical protein
MADLWRQSGTINGPAQRQPCRSSRGYVSSSDVCILSSSASSVVPSGSSSTVRWPYCSSRTSVVAEFRLGRFFFCPRGALGRLFGHRCPFLAFAGFDHRSRGGARSRLPTRRDRGHGAERYSRWGQVNGIRCGDLGWAAITGAIATPHEPAAYEVPPRCVHILHWTCSTCYASCNSESRRLQTRRRPYTADTREHRPG